MENISNLKINEKWKEELIVRLQSENMNKNKIIIILLIMKKKNVFNAGFI